MMKLLLAVIATCALVVSPTCIKIKHQLRSNAPTIHVLISNGNTQMTSQVSRDGSHRFITDNLSSMTLAPAGSQTIQLSYDEIFPITDAAVCTEVHPVSAGGCADGVCCKISISMYTITDAIIMTARVNNRNADGNPQFWKCEQEIQVPGVANTEASVEELVTDILGNESPLGDPCGDGCGTNAVCSSGTCVCEIGYVHGDDGIQCQECNQGVTNQCQYNNYDINTVCKKEDPCQGSCPYLCSCNTDADYYGDGTLCAEEDAACTAGSDDCLSTCTGGSANCLSACTAGSDNCLGACATGYSGDGTTCIDINECTTNLDEYKHECHTDATCAGYTPPGSYNCTCKSEYYGDGFKHSATNPHTGLDGTECTACVTCPDDHWCSNPAISTGTSTCCKTDGCQAKRYGGATCTVNGQCKSGDCTNERCTCDANVSCISRHNCNTSTGVCTPV